MSLAARHGQHFPLHVRNRLAREPPVSSSKLVMRIRFVLLLYDRPLSLRDLGLLTVASPRPVERWPSRFPERPATAPRSPRSLGGPKAT